jgi:hypothetical protein
LIEAGGGKRLIEAGGGKKEGGRRIIEAGGGRRPTAAEAQVEYDSAREDVVLPEGEVAAPEADGDVVDVTVVAPPSSEQGSDGPPAEQGDNPSAEVEESSPVEQGDNPSAEADAPIAEQSDVAASEGEEE